ncbi:MAG: hypothetical protein IID28_04210 [Planctomycetes bacterium]|nr:hypothetical protein [Planctomycetota bacterium]
MSGVLNWVKTNIYTVFAVAAMIAAPVGMWILSGNMNEAVRQEVEDRAKKISEMSRFEKTQVSIHYPVPGNVPVDASIAVNRRFLDRYQEVVDVIRKDTDRVRQEVMRINHKDRAVLVAQLFPRPPAQLREILPQNMYRALHAAYEQLLADVGAGGPPTADEILKKLQRTRARYLDDLHKRSTNTLTADEQAGLTEQLTNTRLSHYADKAKKLKMYATLDALNVPTSSEFPDRAEGEGMSRMFDWQWRLWVKQDILRALAQCNEPYNSIVDAPVKRVVDVFVTDEPGSGGRAAAAPTGGFNTGGRKSGRRTGGSSSRGAETGAAPTSVDPSREVPLDFGYSFTGRTTNPLFDVRRVEVVLIVDSEMMPEVFDALARYNFMTILNARVEPVDLFVAIRDGHFYGGKPVSKVTLALETVWFRAWTTEFMPPELKETLGIPVEAGSTG